MIWAAPRSSKTSESFKRANSIYRQKKEAPDRNSLIGYSSVFTIFRPVQAVCSLWLAEHSAAMIGLLFVTRIYSQIRLQFVNILS
jgi:hypothetical protein